MCLCDPTVRTPYCGKPGCEMPERAAAETPDSLTARARRAARVVTRDRAELLLGLASTIDSLLAENARLRRLCEPVTGEPNIGGDE